jgi:aerobic-type carbon monoxide dehydrogenase small subunit (CoxS/CutS family)
MCRTGSLIVTRTGEFSGQVDADRVYIDGLVTSMKGLVSKIQGRRLVAISEMAEGGANLISQAFAVHTHKFTARYTTLKRA